MNFADGMLTAYNTKWSYINSFTIELDLSPTIKKLVGWTSDLNSRAINLNIVSFNTPQFTNQNIEHYTGDRWFIHNGRDELYRFSITFRDQDQMKLYRKFVATYLFQRTMYFDDIKSTVHLYKDADYADETIKKIATYNNAMIDSVSQLQFSNNTETQIAEFTVEFKCTNPDPENIK